MTESNSKTPGLLIALPVLGAAGMAGTYVSVGHERFWINWIYWLVLLFTIGMGSLFIVALQHLVSARWSIPIRRIPERVSTLLLVVTPIALLGLAAVPLLYPGAKPEALHNPILAGKASWLSLKYFSLRTVIVFTAALISLAFFVRGSLRQDKSKDPLFSSKAKKYAPAFMVAFAFSVTIVAFDWVAGLVPEWYSDIFGVYVFAGSFLSSLSVTVLSILYLKGKNRLPEVRRDHLYSLGTFTFAFTVFWSYIAFAQYMLMWYANLPDEVNWYADRLHGGWHVITVTLAIVHFIIPFFVLSTRDAKSNPKTLRKAALIMLSAHLLDMYWLIFPVFHHAPAFSWPEASFALFFVGIALLWIRKALGWGEDMPVGDPFLREGLEFHL